MAQHHPPCGRTVCSAWICPFRYTPSLISPLCPTLHVQGRLADGCCAGAWICSTTYGGHPGGRVGFGTIAAPIVVSSLCFVHRRVTGSWVRAGLGREVFAPVSPILSWHALRHQSSHGPGFTGVRSTPASVIDSRFFYAFPMVSVGRPAATPPVPL